MPACQAIGQTASPMIFCPGPASPAARLRHRLACFGGAPAGWFKRLVIGERKAEQLVLDAAQVMHAGDDFLAGIAALLDSSGRRLCSRPRNWGRYRPLCLRIQPGQRSRDKSAIRQASFAAESGGRVSRPDLQRRCDAVARPSRCRRLGRRNGPTTGNVSEKSNLAADRIRA
jgi:hypothetical protein